MSRYRRRVVLSRACDLDLHRSCLKSWCECTCHHAPLLDPDPDEAER